MIAKTHDHRIETRARRRGAAVAVAALAALLAEPSGALAAERARSEGAARVAEAHASSSTGYPWEARIASAARYGSERGGRVALAIVDEDGRLRGSRKHSRFLSASLVKAMLLVASLDRPASPFATSARASASCWGR